MARIVQSSIFLASALLGSCMLLLMVGLSMAARPDTFAGLGLEEVGKTGLAIALAAGVGAVLSTVLIRILQLIHDNMEDHAEPEAE